jgi:predicted deacetylase
LPPDFVRKLTELSRVGHALWIHGWTHRDHTTGGEAEFARLDAVHAADRARRALQDWLDAGLPTPDGFCPPCWKMSAETLPLLFRLGFKQVDLRTGVARPEGIEWSPAISSWGGNGRLARLWDRSLPLQYSLLQYQPYHIRITLHPQDLDTRARRSFERILDALD